MRDWMNVPMNEMMTQTQSNKTFVWWHENLRRQHPKRIPWGQAGVYCRHTSFLTLCPDIATVILHSHRPAPFAVSLCRLFVGNGRMIKLVAAGKLSSKHKLSIKNFLLLLQNQNQSLKRLKTRKSQLFLNLPPYFIYTDFFTDIPTKYNAKMP